MVLFVIAGPSLHFASIHLSSSLPHCRQMSPVMLDSVPALPFELWDAISSHLPNRDIKSMRLVCKQFHNAARLRLHRVFLSANPLNIEVFRAIADHDTFRHRVKEIVWDDARFLKGPRRLIYSQMGMMT